MAAAYTVGTVKTHHKTPPPVCSFCGKEHYDFLVEAPPLNKWARSYICDECVEAAVSTLKEARRIERSQGRQR